MPILAKLQIVVPSYSTTFRTLPIAIVLSVTKKIQFKIGYRTPKLLT